MGKLIRFQKRERFKAAHSDQREEARILLFTGVRYERGGDTPDRGKPTPGKPRRHRG